MIRRREGVLTADFADAKRFSTASHSRPILILLLDLLDGLVERVRRAADLSVSPHLARLLGNAMAIDSLCVSNPM